MMQADETYRCTDRECGCDAPPSDERGPPGGARRSSSAGRAPAESPRLRLRWARGEPARSERERFDGADIAHLIRVRGASMDWRRLRARFGPHHRVLLAHLILFGYVYPQDRDRVPDWLLRELLGALEAPMSDHGRRICMGTLLSRSQYLPDLDWGDLDGRLRPIGAMEAEEIEIWTRAADAPEPHAD